MTKSQAVNPGYQPPANPEVEQSLLGAVLVRPSALDDLVGQLFEDDFYSTAHRTIYHAMVDLYGANFPVDLVSVCAYLKDRNQLDALGGPVFLAGLSEQVGFATNVPYYAKIVREKAVLRRLLDASQEIAGGCLAPVDDVAEFVDRAGEKISQVMDKRGAQAHSLADLVPVEEQRIEALHERRHQLIGISTGFKDIDRLTAGLQDSDLIIVAARPSMGKTALALNIAYNAASIPQEPVPVAFFSLEMSKEQLVRRLIGSVGKINSERLRTGRMEPQEWIKFSQTNQLLVKVPIFIDDSPSPTPLEIRSHARRLKMRHGIRLMIVDYLQLVKDPKAKNREQEISGVSRALKALAKELNIPVIALCQLNRDAEKRDDKRPKLSDLRESGAIEQDADLVFLLYRDEVYNEESPHKGIAEVRLAKQRNGATGRINLTYLGEFMRFENHITL
jgi:replicative DNA helicase